MYIYIYIYTYVYIYIYTYIDTYIDLYFDPTKPLQNHAPRSRQLSEALARFTPKFASSQIQLISVRERGSAPKRGRHSTIFFPPNASVQLQPDGLTTHTEKWLLGAGFLGAPPISLTMSTTVPVRKSAAALSASQDPQSCPLLSLSWPLFFFSFLSLWILLLLVLLISLLTYH